MLDLDGMGDVIRSVGQQIMLAERDRMIQEVDMDKSGTIDIGQFM